MDLGAVGGHRTHDCAQVPLLIIVTRRGPIGVVDIADLAGRGHATGCRQAAGLDSLGPLSSLGRSAGLCPRRVVILGSTASTEAFTLDRSCPTPGPAR